MGLPLTLLKDTFAIAQLPASARIPDWATGALVSITRTGHELSIVCDAAGVPAEVKAVRDWHAFRVDGILDFALTGLLVRLAAPLADADISIFAISTHDTDYVLVREQTLAAAVAILNERHTVKVEGD